MKYVYAVPNGGFLDADTGEIRPILEPLLLSLDRFRRGILTGRNLYPILAPIIGNMRRDHGWTASIVAQRQRIKSDRVRGIIYVSHLTYRFAKVGGRKNRYRPGSLKWTVLNLELFTESEDIVGASQALVHLAKQRGITVRHSPGSFGGALLRASSEWEDKRRPAPRFVSEAAREFLPGNLYALRHCYRKIKRGYYLDQKSAHHTIAATVPLPHPHFLKARGYFRSIERGNWREWMPVPRSNHHGLIAATIETRTIAPTKLHLYPPWAQVPGRKHVWIWTPELRLFDDKIRLIHISASLTSYRLDPVLSEFGEWALARLAEGLHQSVKPALLSAYGMLAVRSNDTFVRYSVHGRTKPVRAEVCTLPMLPDVYRSTIKKRYTPLLQNVVARGVIEAEVRTRTLEMARSLEAAGIHAVHLYADGLIADCEQLPFLPSGWRVVSSLTDVSSPNPSSIMAREMVRLPGIPNGRRMAYIRPNADGYALREREPPTIVV